MLYRRLVGEPLRRDRRRLINEEELVSLLVEEFGFRSLQNEAFTLIDQLSLY
ncbi:MAG: glycosyltransferase family 61 protein [Alphaproteobacteria bacterium]|nr:glycosyltransferase family 61 protein [Alphaproteobacteria bacterium]